MKKLKYLPVLLALSLFFLLIGSVSSLGYSNAWPNGQKELPISVVTLTIYPSDKISTTSNVTFFSNSTTGSIDQLCNQTAVANNTKVSCVWRGNFNRSTTYIWYANISVGSNANITKNFNFTTFIAIGGVFVDLRENITSLGELGSFSTGLIGVGLNVIISILRALPEIAIYVFIFVFIFLVMRPIRTFFKSFENILPSKIGKK